LIPSGEQDPAPPPIIYTWVQLVDFTGDGILDYVIADDANGVWYIYPGYRDSSGNWGFSSSFLTVHPEATPTPDTTPTAGYPAPPQTNHYPIMQTQGGYVNIDLRDLNGDGFPDRLVLQQQSDQWGNASGQQWYVDYNVGTEFIPKTFLQSALPWAAPNPGSFFADGAFAGSGIALVDLNGDGRPEFAGMNYTTGPCASGLNIFYNTGTGFNVSSSAGACLPRPASFNLRFPTLRRHEQGWHERRFVRCRWRRCFGLRPLGIYD
jgi:hypothetical protein